MDIIIIILTILVVARIFSEIFARIKQPPIIGELIAGFVIGPSVLNLVSPDVNGLEVLAELGIFFLVLFAGMQLHLGSMKEYYRPAFFIAFMGNNVAIFSGMIMGKLYHLDILSSLFVGVVFSLTALPVGVRILMDMGKLDTPTGKIIITSALLDDIFSVFLFAMILFIAESSSKTPEAGFIAITFVKIVIFLSIIFILNKSLSIKGGFLGNHLISAINKLTKESQFFYILVFGILIGYIGGMLGITFIIGIFYAGTLIKTSTVGQKAYSHMHDVTSSITFGIFSPLFFAYMGLLLDIKSIIDYTNPFSPQNLFQATFFLNSLIFAMAGKSGGALIGGLLANLKLKDAAAVGIGLNARGLMGLVILEIGFKHGLIGQSVYATLVAICLITTFMTPYLLGKMLVTDPKA
ncbi:MAG TPA: cation:proton antiporter [Candidatus Methanoperedens sp.]